MAADYTPRQGQYLAFIHLYTKLNGRPPAEADIQHYFRVSPPAVHDMVDVGRDKSPVSRAEENTRVCGGGRQRQRDRLAGMKPNALY